MGRPNMTSCNSGQFLAPFSSSSHLFSLMQYYCCYKTFDPYQVILEVDCFVVKIKGDNLN